MNESTERSPTGRSARPNAGRRRLVKALISIGVVVVVLAGGVFALTLPPVRDAIEAQFESALAAEPAQTTPTATATEEPSPIPGDRDGDGVLSEFEKQIIEANAPRDYVTRDGTTITVDPTKPLPQAVKDDIAAKLLPVTRWPTSTIELDDKQGMKLFEILDDAAAATGKKLLVVLPSQNGQYGSLRSGGDTSASHWTGIKASTNKQAVVADAEVLAKQLELELIVL